MRIRPAKERPVKHEIARIRHELQRRTLVVRRTEYVTRQMLRLTLAGEALAGFTSLSPDDHIKVFAPGKGGMVERRDYTPRRYDAEKNELIIDFALREAGPATEWARGSVVVPHDFDCWLLIAPFADS
jgi:NADPH-dependent ferric siderophore reductase